MTVQRLPADGAVPRYQGLTTDVKPVDPTILAGATYQELDSGKTYRWDGAAWNFASGTAAQAPAPAGQLEALLALLAVGQQVLRELRLLREGSIAASTCLDVGEVPFGAAPTDDFNG